MKTEYLVIDKNESLWHSLAADAITFGFLAFCIWLSIGSRAWTLVCGLMFFMFIAARIADVYRRRVHKFKTLDAVIAWATEAKGEP